MCWSKHIFFCFIRGALYTEGLAPVLWQATCYEEVLLCFIFKSVLGRDGFCIERAWTLLCNGNLFMRFCCVQVCQPCYCKHSRIVTQIRAWILLQIEWSGEIASLYWYKLMLPVVSDNTCTLEQNSVHPEKQSAASPSFYQMCCDSFFPLKESRILARLIKGAFHDLLIRVSHWNKRGETGV